MMSQRGQALLELAIFGTLMIMILGVIVNYGLNADYTQQALMESFRRASDLATEPGSSSVAVIRDRYIPNPNDPNAAGTAYPITASARVVKDFRMHETADTPDELPKLVLNINGTEHVYTTPSSDDICEGEILDPDSLRLQCQQDSSPWCCSKLAELFPDGQRMGLQQGFTKQAQLSTTLEKTETASGIATTSQVTQKDTITRTVVSKPIGSQSISKETIAVTPKDETTETTWTTDW